MGCHNYILTTFNQVTKKAGKKSILLMDR